MSPAFGGGALAAAAVFAAGVLAGVEAAGVVAAVAGFEGVEAAGAGVVVAAVEAAALSFFDFDFEVEGVVEELAVELAGVVAAAAFDFLPLVDLDVEVVDEDELAGAVA